MTSSCVGYEPRLRPAQRQMAPRSEFLIAVAPRAYTTGIRTSVVRIGKEHGGFMSRPRSAYFVAASFLVLLAAVACFAQEPEGPQTAAPTPVAPALRPVVERRSMSS